MIYWFGAVPHLALSQREREREDTKVYYDGDLPRVIGFGLKTRVNCVRKEKAQSRALSRWERGRVRDRLMKAKLSNSEKRRFRILMKS